MTDTKKQQRWNIAMQNALEIKDKLGCPIEPCIIETVAVLNLLGFPTTMSCEGHLGRVTGGPYVTIESPEAIRLSKEARSLNKKVDEINPEYNRLRDEASRHSMQLLQKLMPYLDGFYKNRNTAYAHRLIIRYFPMTYNCLMCQGAGLASAMDNDEQKSELLNANQLEMRAFTDYLKGIYFNNSNVG